MEMLDKLTNMTKSAASKTANKVAIAKINSRINSLKSSIDAQKLKIGEFYWARLHESESYEPEIASVFESVKNLSLRIESAKAEIEGIVDSERVAELERAGPMILDAALGALSCPLCGAANNPGANFCYGCGGSLAGVSAGVFCPNCGVPMGSGDKFCERCGARREIHADAGEVNTEDEGEKM
jgi:ribosomal protein L40E